MKNCDNIICILNKNCYLEIKRIYISQPDKFKPRITQRKWNPFLKIRSKQTSPILLSTIQVITNINIKGSQKIYIGKISHRQ